MHWQEIGVTTNQHGDDYCAIAGHRICLRLRCVWHDSRRSSRRGITRSYHPSHANRSSYELAQCRHLIRSHAETHHDHSIGPSIQLFCVIAGLILHFFKSESSRPCLRRLAKIQTSLKEVYGNNFHALNCCMELAEVWWKYCFQAELFRVARSCQTTPRSTLTSTNTGTGAIDLAAKDFWAPGGQVDSVLVGCHDYSQLLSCLRSVVRKKAFYEPSQSCYLYRRGECHDVNAIYCWNELLLFDTDYFTYGHGSEYVPNMHALPQAFDLMYAIVLPTLIRGLALGFCDGIKDMYIYRNGCVYIRVLWRCVSNLCLYIVAVWICKMRCAPPFRPRFISQASLPT